MQVLAVMALSEGRDPAELGPYGVEEERRVWALYKAQTIRAMWFRQDLPGAVAMLEAASVEEAGEIARTLPAVRDGLFKLQLIPVGPFLGLEQLFAPEIASKGKRA